MVDIYITTGLDPLGLNRGLKRAKRDVDGFSKGTIASLSKIQGAIGAIGAGLGAGQLVRDALNVSREFEQALSTVRAVTGATEAQFRSLSDEARRLGSITRFSATEAGEGMLALARAGFTVGEALEGTETTLLLAQAGALDLGRAADIASNALGSFSLGVGELGRVADVLAANANSTNTTVAGLGDSLAKIGPIAEITGTSFETVIAALGALGNVGIQASEAGTGVRGVITRLSKFSRQAAGALKELGLTADDVSVETNDLLDIFDTFAERAITVEQAVAIFGREMASVALTLINNRKAIRNSTTALEESGGTAERVASIMDDNLNGAILRLNSAWSELLLTLGSDTGVFRFVVEDTTKAVDNISILVFQVEALGKAISEGDFGLAAKIFAASSEGLREYREELKRVEKEQPLVGGAVGEGANRGFAALAQESATAQRDAAIEAAASDIGVITDEMQRFIDVVAGPSATAQREYEEALKKINESTLSATDKETARAGALALYEQALDELATEESMAAERLATQSGRLAAELEKLAGGLEVAPLQKYAATIEEIDRRVSEGLDERQAAEDRAAAARIRDIELEKIRADALDRAKQENEQWLESLNAVIESLDPVIALQNDYARQLAIVEKALKLGDLEQDDFDDLKGKLEKQLNDGLRELEPRAASYIAGITETIGDALERGADSRDIAKAFASKLLANLIRQIDAGEGLSFGKLFEFHDGAFPVPGAPGTEVFARLEAGETVIPRDATLASGSTVMYEFAPVVIGDAPGMVLESLGNQGEAAAAVLGPALRDQFGLDTSVGV